MRKKLFPYLVFFFCAACGSAPKSQFKLGVDPTWAPWDFGEMQPYVNGFVSDLLLEIAEYTGVSFDKITVNETILFQSLANRELEGALGSLPRYNYNEAKYVFSENFLDLGPVLVVPKHASYPPWKKWKSGSVGVLENSVSTEIIEMHPHIIFKEYPSIPELFNGVVLGEVDAALHDRIPAIGYLRDLYQDTLKVVHGPPFTNAGLRLILPKGDYDYHVWKFNEGLKSLKKRGKVEALLRKWQLQ